MPIGARLIVAVEEPTSVDRPASDPGHAWIAAGNHLFRCPACRAECSDPRQVEVSCYEMHLKISDGRGTLRGGWRRG